MKVKIAIAGSICSGKTTLAKMIAKKYSSYHFHHISFATKIKSIVQELFHPDKKDRELLIEVGSNMRRIVPDVWINYVLYKTEHSNHFSWIIDDLRFKNEFDKLKQSKDWKIIKIELSDDIREQRIRALYPDDFNIHLGCLSKEKKELDSIDNNQFDMVFKVTKNDSESQYLEIEQQLETFMKKYFEKEHDNDIDEERDPICWLAFVMWGLLLSRIIYNYMINFYNSE
jgi:adenylate kinase family enzyme